MTKKPTLGQILIMAGGVLTFIFSFLDWISIGSFSKNAWGGNGSGLFPTYTLVGILALVIGALIAVKVFAGSLPEKFWIFDVDQLSVIVGAGTLVTTLCYMIADKGGASTGIGAILSIFTTAAILAGAVLEVQGIDPLANAGGGSAPTGYPQQQWQQPGQPGQPAAQPGWGQPPAPQAPPAPQQPPAQAPGWGQPPAPQAPPPPPPGVGQTPPPPPPPSGQAF